MEKLWKCTMGAFAGWLLVGVAHALPEALHDLLRPLFGPGLPPLRSLGHLVALLGWSATVVLSVPVLAAAWSALRSRAGQNRGVPRPARQ